MNYTVIKRSGHHRLPYKKEILQMLRSDKNIYLLLLGIFFVILIVMLPFKDQLFSEDFAYAQSVRHLITTGDLKISERVAPSSITLIVWGAIITKISGFSLANLHLSVAVLIPFLLIALYKLFYLAGASKQKSLIFTLFFLSIPWILQLSYTFLTDIPFLTLEVFALLFYLRGFKKDRPIDILLGSIFASLAFLTRQLGIAFVLAAFITVLFKKDNNRRKFKYLFLSTFVPVFTGIVYLWWLSLPENKTIAQYAVYQEFRNIYFHPELNIWIENIARIIHRTIKFISQAQVLLFPLVLLFLLSNLKKAFHLLNKNKTSFSIITIIAAFIYALDIINFRQEYTFGFPLLIYDYENLLPIPWAHIWKYIVLISFPLLSCTIYLNKRTIFKLNSFGQFTLLNLFFLTILTVIYVASWEQYIIPFLPILMLWIAGLTKKLAINTKLALVFVLILLLDSVQMTKLRYSQSGLIWEKAMELVNSGISPTEIDPNNNFGWYYWFYFEKLASNSIKNAGGNKENGTSSFIIKKPLFPKYRIYTPKMISYTNPDTTNYKVESVSFRSLFVNSKIYIMQLYER